MDNVEREEVKDIVHEVTIGPLSRIEASINVIEFRLTSMDTHMRVANGNTARNVKKIDIIEHRVSGVESELKARELTCPQSETLEKIEEAITSLTNDKVARDKAESLIDHRGDDEREARAEKRAKALKVIETIGVIIAALALIANLLWSHGAYNREPAITDTPQATTNTYGGSAGY